MQCQLRRAELLKLFMRPVSRAISCRGAFRKALEDATKIGRITKATADGDIIQLQVVVREQMLATINPYMCQVTAECHASVSLKQAGKVIGSNAKLLRYKIPGHVILIVVLQINADGFQKTLGTVHYTRFRMLEEITNDSD